MTVICLGPCCIPLSAIIPFLLFLLAPILNLLRKSPLAKYLPNLGAKTAKCATKDCCNTSSGGDDDDDGTVGDEGEASTSNGAMGDVKMVKSLEHWEELKRSEPLLIADFSAGWCKPCKNIAPVFESLATEHKGVAAFVKVDIDDLPEIFDGISIPAFQILREGSKVDSFSGAAEERLRNMVAKHCKKNK